MKTYSSAELAEIIEKHGLWLQNEGDGERANLRGANLQGANLGGADLANADLEGANLTDAVVAGAFGACFQEFWQGEEACRLNIRADWARGQAELARLKAGR